MAIDGSSAIQEGALAGHSPSERAIELNDEQRTVIVASARATLRASAGMCCFNRSTGIRAALTSTAASGWCR